MAHNYSPRSDDVIDIVGNRRVIIRGDAFRCKTQFIRLVLSSALGGIRALTRKSESGKEKERGCWASLGNGTRSVPPSHI
ncbi:hypothetical protein TNCV_3483301 [Trichonephila clavipes]|nr:hypothetical protein TNCV_3483301 [Trichonephila clavipes]